MSTADQMELNMGCCLHACVLGSHVNHTDIVRSIDIWLVVRVLHLMHIQ